MTIGFIFWLLMLLWLLSLIGAAFGREQWPWAPHASAVLTFVLLALLGVHDFGWPIRG